MNKQEVLMRTPLLRIARHRSMVTPVSPVRTRLIHISPNSRTIYRSFEILEWGPVAKLTGGQSPPRAGHFEVFGPAVTTLLILLSDL